MIRRFGTPLDIVRHRSLRLVVALPAEPASLSRADHEVRNSRLPQRRGIAHWTVDSLMFLGTPEWVRTADRAPVPKGIRVLQWKFICSIAYIPTICFGDPSEQLR